MRPPDETPLISEDPIEIPKECLEIEFESADLVELKDLQILIDGSHQCFSIGEGEDNDYQIPNDKKILGT